jgi:hypothetical protein
MGVSYVAKPAIVVTPNYPPDWSFEWSLNPDLWPGPPFSPGYEPAYSVTLSAPSEMVVGNAVSDITLTANDHTSYGTTTPTNVTYTATLLSTGATIQMSYSSASGPWLSSLDGGSFSESGGIYTNYPDPMYFNVGLANDGDSIVLQGAGTVNGQTKTDTENILINSPYTITLEIDFDPGGGALQKYICETTLAADSGSSLTQIGWSLLGNAHSFPGDNWIHNESYAGNITITSPVDAVNGTALFSGELVDSTYQIKIRGEATPNTAPTTWTLKVWKGGEVQSTTVKNFTFTDPWAPVTDYGHEIIWVTINGATGVVTLVDDEGVMDNGNYIDPLA